MIVTEQLQWTCVADARATVGEEPIYSLQEEALYWIDIFEPSLNRTHIASGRTYKWALPAMGGSYALLDDGTGAIVAVADGLYKLDFASSEAVLLRKAPYDQQNFRFNDGRCDPQGRFWVGTTRLPESKRPNGSGSVYTFDGISLTRSIGGVTIANGIAFDPERRTMYLADRVNSRILSYDFDGVTGAASGQRTFTSIPVHMIPDGAAVDTLGGYWVAMFGSGELHRYSPDGRLSRVVATPTSQPTMCAFGGPDLGMLYVTTARAFLSSDQLTQQPLAGAILAADVGETGIREPRFRQKARVVNSQGQQ
jgi:L-arabinonolactonase